MKKLVFLALTSGILVSCEQQPKTYTIQEARAICEEKQRDAQGPRTNVTVGANSESGGFGGVSIALSDSYLRGEDPKLVYDKCMASLPIRDAAIAAQTTTVN